MKKLNKLEKELYREEQEKRSKELFNKSYYQLQLGELITLNMYMHDLINPQWHPVVLSARDKTRYLVSNTGLIKNVETGKLLKPWYDHKGYAKVKLYYSPNNNGVVRFETDMFVHRLVAISFIPNPEFKPQVNHKNGKKAMNWVGNLEWNTAQENINHAVANGLQNHPIGENANHSKYMESQIHSVCKLLEEGKYLNVEIAKLTGVDEYSISKVKCKKDWVHISQLYNIKTPVSNAVGSDAAASKYTDDMIHSVCKLLSNKNNTMSYISEQTGVGYDMVYRIKKGLNWSHISSCYPELGISRSDTTTQDKLG